MKALILLATIIIFSSCNQTKNNSYSVESNNKEIHPGKILLENQCYICHNPTSSQEERLAPPMIAVKKHYISEKITKEDFINDMQDWFENPTEENAKMYGAVRRFGLMPKLVVSKENLKLISDYIYNNDIEQPEWFDAHYNEEKQKGFSMRNGKQIYNK